MAWVFRHLTEADRTAVFDIIGKTEAVGEFLSELDDSFVIELVKHDQCGDNKTYGN